MEKKIEKINKIHKTKKKMDGICPYAKKCGGCDYQGVEYEKQPESYREEVKVNNFEEENTKKEIPPVKSSINLLSTLKKSMGDDVDSQPKKEENLELTDDLFNLIDSMYDERNENK